MGRDLVGVVCCGVAFLVCCGVFGVVWCGLWVVRCDRECGGEGDVCADQGSMLDAMYHCGRHIGYDHVCANGRGDHSAG